MSLRMFKGRTLVIATKHGKEEVIAPVLQNELGVKTMVPTNFDTDKFGTFTGEVERKLDPLSVARQKCLAAMEATGCSLAVASEGSFGPHPHLFFAGCDDEILLLMDKNNALDIYIRHLSLHTNFARRQITNEQQLIELAGQAKFPSHKLILKATIDEDVTYIKGISNFDNLLAKYRQFANMGCVVEVETDMRAMNNPSRMLVIAQAAKLLTDKVKSCCPQCATPGFGITDVEQGLPCEFCTQPTTSVIANILTCKKCNYTYRELYPKGIVVEDPQYCQQCNP